MARQHSLGEFEQKLTGGTLRQNLETSLGFGDDLTSGFHRLIERLRKNRAIQQARNDPWI